MPPTNKSWYYSFASASKFGAYPVHYINLIISPLIINWLHWGEMDTGDHVVCYNSKPSRCNNFISNGPIALHFYSWMLIWSYFNKFVNDKHDKHPLVFVMKLCIPQYLKCNYHFIIFVYNIYFALFQLRNAVYDLEYPKLQEMHNLLEKLKSCRGPRECTIRFRNDLEEGDW